MIVNYFSSKYDTSTLHPKAKKIMAGTVRYHLSKLARIGNKTAAMLEMETKLSNILKEL